MLSEFSDHLHHGGRATAKAGLGSIWLLSSLQCREMGDKEIFQPLSLLHAHLQLTRPKHISLILSVED